MKRYAQLESVNEKIKRVHWVFEAEAKPEFAPYIEIMEVDESIKEGMFYLVDEGRFVEAFELPKEPSVEERLAALEDAFLLILMEG